MGNELSGDALILTAMILGGVIGAAVALHRAAKASRKANRHIHRRMSDYPWGKGHLNRSDKN